MAFSGNPCFHFLAFLLALLANFSSPGGINDEFFHANSLVVKLAVKGISQILKKKKKNPFLLLIIIIALYGSHSVLYVFGHTD